MAESREPVLDFAHERAAAHLGILLAPAPLPDDPMLSQPGGCFVSLHDARTHRLRGCIGSLQSKRSLVEAIAHAAEGVLHDPRFSGRPVKPAVWPELEIELTILGAMEPLKSLDDFQPLEHGIQLSIGDKTGLFLPQVARETGWPREELLARLCTEKLAMPGNAWKHESAELQIFSVQVLGPRRCSGKNE